MWSLINRFRQINALATITRSYHYLNRQTVVQSVFNTNNNNNTTLINNNLLLKTVTPLINPNCGFKVKGKLKRRCKDCYFVVRGERLYNICKTHPRHKQMAMKKDDDKSWIITHATQSKVRSY